jgi:hypothetical protein
LKKPSSFKGIEVVLEMQSFLHWNFLLQDWKKASSLNGVEVVPEKCDLFCTGICAYKIGKKSPSSSLGENIL